MEPPIRKGLCPALFKEREFSGQDDSIPCGRWFGYKRRTGSLRAYANPADSSNDRILRLIDS